MGSKAFPGVLMVALLASPFATLAAQPDNHDRTPHAASCKYAEMKSAFVVNRISDRLYAISEPDYYQANNSYLIIGDKHALMFDAGANSREDITKVVRGITAMPLSVMPSHLHYDHLGGIRFFDSIYLPDVPGVRRFEKVDGTYVIPDSTHLGSVDGFVPPAIRPAALIKPGDMIDLGGIKLRMLFSPGHTQDSVILYDEANNIMLTGDHLYPSQLLAGNVEQYSQSIAWTLGVGNNETRFFGAHPADRHAVPEMSYSSIARALNVLNDIKAGRATGKHVSDPDLIKSGKEYTVDDKISILTDVIFQNGNRFGYQTR